MRKCPAILPNDYYSQFSPREDSAADLAYWIDLRPVIHRLLRQVVGSVLRKNIIYFIFFS